MDIRAGNLIGQKSEFARDWSILRAKINKFAYEAAQISRLFRCGGIRFRGGVS